LSSFTLVSSNNIIIMTLDTNRRSFPIREKADQQRVLEQNESLRNLIHQDSTHFNKILYSSKCPLQQSVQNIMEGKLMDSHLGGSCQGFAFSDDFLGGDEESDPLPGRATEKATSTIVTGGSPLKPEEQLVIEVTTGVTMPLRGAIETWQAIQEGHVTVTTCSACQMELHCMKTAELVICPDCWVISSIDQVVGGIQLESDGLIDIDDQGGSSSTTTADQPCSGVALGIKATHVVQWLEAGL
jgi:hypothetical protein